MQAAQERARVLSESVKKGVCMPPKRNRPFEMQDPAQLGMVRLGPFWYSQDPESPFFLSYEAYDVLKRILPFYEDPANLLKFHKARSVANLRFFLNFHILHCKTAQVLACDQQDTFMVDFSNEYRAMQRRYTRDLFDEFNRGPCVLLFDAPPEVLQAHGLPANPPDLSQLPPPQPHTAAHTAAHTAPHTVADVSCAAGPAHGAPAQDEAEDGGGGEDGAEGEGEGEGEGEDGGEGEGEGDAQGDGAQVGRGTRHMLCVAPRQLNYFHWIFATGKYEVMCEREPHLHPTLNGYVKRHRERKTDMNLHTRLKLCGDSRGLVIVDRPATFTMRL
jgi:hypothetical protein